jgi:hypothetical protein
VKPNFVNLCLKGGADERNMRIPMA